MDKELLKEYFPMDTVTKGMLKIYQDLLGLKFVECTHDVDKWQEEVRLVRHFIFVGAKQGGIFAD